MTVDTLLGHLAENRYQNSFVVVWGLSYWSTLLVKPDIVGGFDPRLSMAGLFLVGGIILGNLVVENRLLWVLLGAFMTTGVASSWAEITQWNVALPPEIAGTTMAVFNGIAGVVAFAKALEEPADEDPSVTTKPTEPQGMQAE